MRALMRPIAALTIALIGALAGSGDALAAACATQARWDNNVHAANTISYCDGTATQAMMGSTPAGTCAAILGSAVNGQVKQAGGHLYFCDGTNAFQMDSATVVAGGCATDGLVNWDAGTTAPYFCYGAIKHSLKQVTASPVTIWSNNTFYVVASKAFSLPTYATSTAGSITAWAKSSTNFAGTTISNPAWLTVAGTTSTGTLSGTAPATLGANTASIVATDSTGKTLVQDITINVIANPCGTNGVFTAPNKCIYTTPATLDAFNVPAYKPQLFLFAVGAGGGVGDQSGSNGGYGAAISGSLDSTSYSTLGIMVPTSVNVASANNVGGTGGGAALIFSGAGVTSCTGGTPLLVAGGGGGGGGTGSTNGGAGGIPNGSSGIAGAAQTPGGPGAIGSTPGLAAVPTCASCSALPQGAGSGYCGGGNLRATNISAGGTGGTGSASGKGAGGGGSGYAGGGAGGNNAGANTYTAGAGGGGSSYTAPALTSPSWLTAGTSADTDRASGNYGLYGYSINASKQGLVKITMSLGSVVITSAQNQTASPYTTTTITPSAWDPNGGSITSWSVSSAPAGCGSMTAGTGAMACFLAPGTYNYTITSTSGSGATGTQSVTLTVPTASSPCPNPLGGSFQTASGGTGANKCIVYATAYNTAGGVKTVFVAPVTTTVTFEVWGAAGGPFYGPMPATSGGTGGYVSGSIAVTAGNVYTIFVGQGGTAGSYGGSGGGITGVWNTNSGASNPGCAVAGGISNPLLIAGAGGGSGSNGSSSVGGAAGSSANSGGVGATVGGAGAGQINNGCSPAGPGNSGSGSCGGKAGQGSGDAAWPKGGSGSDGGSGRSGYAGGGGGAGYYGGGGGTGNYSTCTNPATGGGGGGSNYIDASVTTILNQNSPYSNAEYTTVMTSWGKAPGVSYSSSGQQGAGGMVAVIW